ncbi:MAG: hypothetical protein ABIT10_12425 [Alteraurantiacibacter sp.]
MDQPGRETHIDADDARSGETPHIVRWVLGISLLLAIIAMSVVWLIPTLSGTATVDERPPETITNDG